jgi:hypothetical protein
VPAIEAGKAADRLDPRGGIPAVAAGVRIACGTDTPAVPHGDNAGPAG